MNRNELRQHLSGKHTPEDIQAAFEHADEKEGLQVMNVTESYRLRVTNFLADNNWTEDLINKSNSIY